MSGVLAVLLVATVLASALLTGVVRHYALRTQLLDLPNARSSHVRPTPRGGGVAVVVAFELSLLALWLLGGVPLPLFLALLVGGLMIAAVGLIDDRRGVAARWRFLVHLLAAVWALAWLGFPALPVGGSTVDLGWLGLVLGALMIVWLVNLYNFMDGIDAIAGIEALTVAVGAALLAADSGAGGVLGLLALAVLGFLVWNWPPAKIFMGDVGSAFLGFVFAALALFAGGLSLWGWLILLGVFIVDATWTLLRRVLRGERWYEAHRSHAYQRAARRCGSHLRVSVVVGLVNVLWLLPLAYGAQRWPGYGPALVAVAYVPLLAAAARLGAGRPD